MINKPVLNKDEYYDLQLYLNCELKRQNEGLELIASENYVSKDILAVQGSILTNKYAEGYPGKRYYGGCEFVDGIESMCIDKCCELFNCKYANVQPHSGTNANLAAFIAALPNGGKVLTINLDEGGHLSHVSPLSITSKLFTACTYHLDENGKLDYKEIEKVALKELPDLILCGYSAYPYEIDFKKFRKITDKVNNIKFKLIDIEFDKESIEKGFKTSGCLLMADIAHIAGLVVAKEHPSPFPYADIVTSTTHKTLRGPRSGIIMTNDEELSKRINKAVFPNTQGGPLEHIIAAKLVCFIEASKPEFKEYIKNVKINTKAFRDRLAEKGVICSDTENHLLLIDTIKSFNKTGKEVQELLEEIGITTNKNKIPGDTLSANLTSGIRIGFPALTTRGCTKELAERIADCIYNYLTGKINDSKAFLEVKCIASELEKLYED